MNRDLIERYIYAATKDMPKKQREDIAQELHGLIEDMLAERCGDAAPTEKDIRVVLTELGTPKELAARYDEDPKKCLIGQPYYNTYKFVLKIVLIAAAAGLTAVNLLLLWVEPKGWVDALTTWLSMVYNSLLAAFTIVTLLFSYFYHKNIRIAEHFSFDDLPPVPKKSQELSRSGSIFGMIGWVLFAVLLLAAPQCLGFSVDSNGVMNPMFHVSVVRSSWYIIVGIALCGVIRNIIQLLEGRYNRTVMTTTLLSNGLQGLLGLWWLTGFDLIRKGFADDFLANAGTQLQSSDSIIVTILNNLQPTFLIIMIFVLVADSITVCLKTLRK